MSDAHEARVAAQFGPRAKAYVESAVHARGPDLEQLEAIVKAAAPESGARPRRRRGPCRLSDGAARAIGGRGGLVGRDAGGGSSFRERAWARQHRDGARAGGEAAFRRRRLRLRRFPLLRSSLARLRRGLAGGAPRRQTWRRRRLHGRLRARVGLARHPPPGGRDSCATRRMSATTRPPNGSPRSRRPASPSRAFRPSASAWTIRCGLRACAPRPKTPARSGSSRRRRLRKRGRISRSRPTDRSCSTC